MGKMNEIVIKASEIYAANKGIELEEAMKIVMEDMTLSEVFKIIEASDNLEKNGYLTVGELKSLLAGKDNNDVVLLYDADTNKYRHVTAIGHVIDENEPNHGIAFMAGHSLEDKLNIIFDTRCDDILYTYTKPTTWTTD